MYFPKLKAAAQQRAGVEQFGGLDRRPGSGAGSLEQMENLWSSGYPALETRPLRRTVTQLAKPNGMTEKDGLFWVDGTALYVNGAKTGLVLTDSRKQLVSMGAYLLIFPDKKYINRAAGPLGQSGTQERFGKALIHDATVGLHQLLDFGLRAVATFRNLSIDGGDDGAQVYGLLVDHGTGVSVNGDWLKFFPVGVVVGVHFQGHCEEVLAAENGKGTAPLCLFADIVAPVPHERFLTAATLGGHEPQIGETLCIFGIQITGALFGVVAAGV